MQPSFFIYKGTNLAPHELIDGMFKPNPTQTETQNRNGSAKENYVIGTAIKEYALCYALYSVREGAPCLHDFMDNIPFVITEENAVNIAQMDNKKGFLYKFHSAPFNQVDKDGREYISLRNVIPAGMPAEYSQRQILDMGVQFYTASKENLHKLFSRASEIDKNLSRQEYEKRLKSIIIQAVIKQELCHVNQKLKANPRAFKTNVLSDVIKSKSAKVL